MHGYFWEDQNSIYNDEIASIGLERNVNFKLGEVTDKDILNKIKKGEYSGLEELLEYAKDYDGKVVTGTRKVASGLEPIFKQSDLVEGKYYFIYLELDDEEGTYYPVEDVNLYQARLSTTSNLLWLVDYSDKKFVWEEEKIDTVWENFVKAFKENETTKKFSDDITIEYDADSLTITYGEVVTIFNYKDGIVSYEASENRTDEELMIDSLWQYVIVDEFHQKFEYDVEKVSAYLEGKTDLTIEEDGIEFVSKELEINENGEGASLGISIEGVFTKLKLDIVNGLKNYKEETESGKTDEVGPDKPLGEDPDTGLKIGASIVLSLLVVGGTIIYIYNRTTKKNRLRRI